MDSHRPVAVEGDPRSPARSPARARLRAALPYLAIGLLLVVAVLAAGRELEQHLDATRAWIAGLGPWGVPAFVVLFVLATTVLVPDSLLCVLAGVLFGVAWGAAAVVAGGLLAAALQYALAHRLLRAWVERRLAARPRLAAIRRAVARDELRLQVLLRLTPLSPTTVSYLLGAAGVPLAGFLAASLAHAPYLILEVYLGHAGAHVVRLGGSGGRSGAVHELALLGGVALSLVAVVLVSRTARKALARAVDAS